MTALTDTERWLERAVIGLNLCPFAKAVHGKGQIRWVLSRSRTPEGLLRTLLHELQWLAAAKPRETDTTLIVHPQVLQRFDDFNRFLGVADAAVHELGLEGVIQVASFHPRYRFAGTRAADITNATNRSPFPTLHLLREASIGRAVAAFPDAEAIFGRNQATLKRLGAVGWQKLLR